MLKNRSVEQSMYPRWTWEKTVVGVITNSDDRVPSVLQSFGLKIGPRRVGSSGERVMQANADDDISFVVLSYDVGVEKPNRHIFDAARQMLQETMAENSGLDRPVSIQEFRTLYVGDSLEHDYFGAKEAGWDAVLVDRSESPAIKVEQVSRGTPLSGIYKEDRWVDGVVKEVVVCSSLVALAGWQPGRLRHVKKRMQIKP
jgi:hypothetical protein